MFDVSDDAKGEFRRVEVLMGPGRRRRWSADEKAQIVAQQVFGWRRAMRQDVPSAPREPTTPATPSFVPIVSEAIPAATVRRAASGAPEIEVKLAGAVVRVSPGMDDAAQLTAVLRAVRASASRSRSMFRLALGSCWRRVRSTSAKVHTLSPPWRRRCWPRIR